MGSDDLTLAYAEKLVYSSFDFHAKSVGGAGRIDAAFACGVRKPSSGT